MKESRGNRVWFSSMVSLIHPSAKDRRFLSELSFLLANTSSHSATNIRRIQGESEEGKGGEEASVLQETRSWSQSRLLRRL